MERQDLSGSSKPKHASTLLQLIDTETSENGSTSISTMWSVEDGGPWARELPFSEVPRAPDGEYGDISVHMDQKLKIFILVRISI